MGHSRDTIRDTVEWLRDGVHRHGQGSLRLDPQLALVPGADRDPQSRGNRPQGRQLVTCGSDRAIRAPITPVTARSPGATSGPSAPARLATSPATTWTRQCGALELGTPESVEAYAAGPMTKDVGPWGAVCYYKFPKRGNFPPLKITWMDGGLKPPVPAELGPKGTLINRRRPVRRRQGQDAVRGGRRPAALAALQKDRRIHEAGQDDPARQGSPTPIGFRPAKAASPPAPTSSTARA